MRSTARSVSASRPTRSARERTAVGQPRRERRRRADDVAVGEDEAVGSEDDARAAAAIDVDLDDGGADRLDGVA